MRAESRKTQLLTQQVGDELVIYDEQSHEAHHLSPTAAVVWRTADGTRSLPELSATLRESISASEPATAVSDEDGEALVRLALDELNRVGLLARGLPGIGDPMTRREMIGVSAALLPVIASILAPTPAMAQTTTPTFPFQSFNGTYVGPGAPGTPNICGLGASQVTIVLNMQNVAGTGFGRMTIQHGTGTTFDVNPATAVIVSATSIRVNGISFGGYTTTNDFVFTLGTGGSASATGTQQITYPECGTTPYTTTNATRR